MSDLILGLDSGIINPNDLTEIEFGFRGGQSDFDFPDFECSTLIKAKFNDVLLTEEELNIINNEYPEWVKDKTINNYYKHYII